jgi:hypothetical protein
MPVSSEQEERDEASRSSRFAIDGLITNVLVNNTGVPPSRSLSVFKPLDLLGRYPQQGRGGDRHDLEPKGTREDTRHEIYTGSGSRSSYPMSCLE